MDQGEYKIQEFVVGWNHYQMSKNKIYVKFMRLFKEMVQ
jgi:hypothetical protein